MIEMDQNFNKVFWDACANGDFPMVCSQIKAGADVNYQNGDGRTALMRAVSVTVKMLCRFYLIMGLM